MGSGTAGAGAPSPDPTPDLRSQAVAFEESEEAYKAEPIYTLLLEEAMAKEGPASTAAIDARR